jgi:hypothetical protein
MKRIVFSSSLLRKSFVRTRDVSEELGLQLAAATRAGAPARVDAAPDHRGLVI